MIIEYSIEDLRSELVSDDRKAIEGILRTALHDVVEQIKAGSETSRNINDRGRQSFPGTSHTTIHWQSRQMSDGKLTAYGVVSELKSLFEQNELYDERLVFFTKEFPKIVRLSNQLNITIGEFTLDEMGQLATGEADQALLAKYSRSVLVEEISPYDFFSQGNSFAASEEPYTEFDSAASGMVFASKTFLTGILLLICRKYMLMVSIITILLNSIGVCQMETIGNQLSIHLKSMAVMVR